MKHKRKKNNLTIAKITEATFKMATIALCQ